MPIQVPEISPSELRNDTCSAVPLMAASSYLTGRGVCT